MPRSFISWAGSLILCLAGSGFVLAPTVAAAACQQWDVSGAWSITQDNDFVVELNLRQDGNQLSGQAASHRTGDMAPKPDQLVGSIEGRKVTFTVDWVYFQSVGVYMGTIDANGNMKGKTHDRAHPLAEGSNAKWRANRAAVCMDAPEPARPVLGLGKVKGPDGKSLPAPVPGSICEAAQSALKRNSPAAPGLEAQCRAYEAANPPSVVVGGAITLDALGEYAAIGRELAQQDPLATELRKRQEKGAGQSGFDIGMGAAQGHTSPGPGKQAIANMLSGDERQGFDIAVAFSLERNRNAQLAAVGANIARRDKGVANARTADRDVFYWLGFDVATGIFGDPARGAKGNTATGPGSMKIRDLLGSAGQRGFDAAVAYHLARTY